MRNKITIELTENDEGLWDTKIQLPENWVGNQPNFISHEDDTYLTYLELTQECDLDGTPTDEDVLRILPEGYASLQLRVIGKLKVPEDFMPCMIICHSGDDDDDDEPYYNA